MGAEIASAVQIDRPLDWIQAQHDNGRLSVDCDIEALQEALQGALPCMDEIPILTDGTAQTLPDGCLVRCTGMIQDMTDPEYGVGAYQTTDGRWISTRFGMPKGAQNTAPASEPRLLERRPVVLVPIPGEAPWSVGPRTEAAQKLAGSLSPAGPGGAGARAASGEAAGKKRTREEGGAAGGAARKEWPARGDDCAPLAKVLEEGEHEEMPGTVFVHVSWECAALALHRSVEVVGVFQASRDEAGNASSDPPTVHALQVCDEPPMVAVPLPSAGQAEELREAALGLIQEALGGDRVAATALLLQLVSRVHARPGAEEPPVGVVALNLIEGPAQTVPLAWGASQVLAALMKALCPRSAVVRLSVEELNSRPWWPRREGGSLRLTPGALQLAPGTQVLVDETALSQGTLKDAGVKNLAALARLARAQLLAAEFQVFALEQPMDCPVTLISQGRSLLKEANALAVPLCPERALASKEALTQLSRDPRLPTLRAFLGHVRSLDCAIPQEMMVAMTRDLVQLRARNPQVTQEDMHRLLTVARLTALSHGEAALTQQRWEEAQGWEAERVRRLPEARKA